MGNRGERIKELREKAALTPDAVAERLGINISWYWDLESYDDEVTDTLTLNQVFILADVLKVTARDLLCENEEDAFLPECRPNELVLRIRNFLNSEGIDIKDLEDQVGWELVWFLDDPESVFGQPAMFLQSLCNRLGINWIETIPIKNLHNKSF